MSEWNNEGIHKIFIEDAEEDQISSRRSDNRESKKKK